MAAYGRSSLSSLLEQMAPLIPAGGSDDNLAAARKNRGRLLFQPAMMSPREERNVTTNSDDLGVGRQEMNDAASVGYLTRLRLPRYASTIDRSCGSSAVGRVRRSGGRRPADLLQRRAKRARSPPLFRRC
uniref:Uncharacterized protein n=1 Tax=Plectus sambesii TaxID=2011161 RepID=A0A914W9H7_9BILA